MELIKFDFDTAINLVNELTTCIDVLESENYKLQCDFNALHSDFNDAYYDEFAAEFQKGDRYTKEIIEVIRELSVNVLEYAKQLVEL